MLPINFLWIHIKNVQIRYFRDVYQSKYEHIFYGKPTNYVGAKVRDSWAKIFYFFTIESINYHKPYKTGMSCDFVV